MGASVGGGGGRNSQWFVLLVAVLGIPSGCRSSRDLERFARRHRGALNEALGLEYKRWPSDATFLYLFNKAHLQEFGQVLQAWRISQIPGRAEGLDQLVFDGKTLRGSPLETGDGSHRFVAQFTLYARALGVTLAQTAYDNSESSERAALEELLASLDLEGVLIQADALHTTQVFSLVPRPGADVLLMVKGNQKTLHRQIRSQFQGQRKIPFTATNHEKRHGRDTIWVLRSREAPEHIKENWPGCSWIVEVVITVICKGKRAERGHYFLTSLRTAPKALLRLVRQRWSIENEWHWVGDVQLGKDAHRYANRIGAPLFSFLRTVVMNLFCRAGCRSVQAGQQELAHGISRMLALGGMRHEPHLIRPLGGPGLQGVGCVRLVWRTPTDVMYPALNTIFNGNHIDVFSYSPRTYSDEFWVTFSSFETPEPFGLRLFQKRNCHALFVVPKANEWYQHEEIWGALRLCRQILDASSAKPIVYGSSMGGFAALAFSSDLNARIVIAGSPQVSIDPRIVGSFDMRWSDIGSRLKYVRADCRDGIVSSSKIYIVYDSLHKEDRQHAEKLISMPNIDAIRLPVSGHGVLHTLRDLGLVRILIEALIQENNQELISEIRHEFKRRKRSSFNYYFALAERLMSQKRYQAASAFLRKSIELNPSFHLNYSLLGEALWNLGEQEVALQSMARACELAPTIGAHRIHVGNRLIELNRLEEAIKVFETAIEDFPNLTCAYSGLATALTRQSIESLQRASQLYVMALKDDQSPIQWNLDAAYVGMWSHCCATGIDVVFSWLQPRKQGATQLK